MEILNNIVYGLGCTITMLLGFSVFFIMALRFNKRVDNFLHIHKKSGREWLTAQLKLKDTLLVKEINSAKYQIKIAKTSKQATEDVKRWMVEEA